MNPSQSPPESAIGYPVTSQAGPLRAAAISGPSASNQQQFEPSPMTWSPQGAGPQASVPGSNPAIRLNPQELLLVPESKAQTVSQQPQSLSKIQAGSPVKLDSQASPQGQKAAARETGRMSSPNPASQPLEVPLDSVTVPAQRLVAKASLETKSLSGQPVFWPASDSANKAPVLAPLPSTASQPEPIQGHTLQQQKPAQSSSPLPPTIPFRKTPAEAAPAGASAVGQPKFRPMSTLPPQPQKVATSAAAGRPLSNGSITLPRPTFTVSTGSIAGGAEQQPVLRLRGSTQSPPVQAVRPASTGSPDKPATSSFRVLGVPFQERKKSASSAQAASLQAAPPVQTVCTDTAVFMPLSPNRSRSDLRYLRMPIRT